MLKFGIFRYGATHNQTEVLARYTPEGILVTTFKGNSNMEVPIEYL